MKRHLSQPARKLQIPSRYEWDFSKVPDSMVRAAWEIEWSRELTNNDPPWLHLDCNTQERIVHYFRNLNPQAVQIGPIPIAALEDPEFKEDFRMWKEQGGLRLFMINWSAPASVIKKRLCKCIDNDLVSARKLWGFPVHGTMKGRHPSYRTRLLALALYRLYTKYCFTKKETISLKEVEVMAKRSGVWAAMSRPCSKRFFDHVAWVRRRLKEQQHDMWQPWVSLIDAARAS